jgi:hypothetical protein
MDGEFVEARVASRSALSTRGMRCKI